MADHDTHDHTGVPGVGGDDLDAIITASSGQDIADALAGAASPDAGNVFATMADIGGGGGTRTVVSDDFNRANGAVGHASGAGQQLWYVQSGTWAIAGNTLNESGGGAERFIFIHSGPSQGKRTITWVLNTKPSSGDGGLVFRASPVASSSTPNSALLLNLEATYKLYQLTNGATYNNIATSTGSAASPANGDTIVVEDDGYEITVTVNGGSPFTYLTLEGFDQVPNKAGSWVGFRSASSTTIKHDSILVVDN
jgi:hypothetical protein